MTTTEKLDRLKNQLLDAVSKKLTTIKHQLNIRDGIPVLTQDFKWVCSNGGFLSVD